MVLTTCRPPAIGNRDYDWLKADDNPHLDVGQMSADPLPRTFVRFALKAYYCGLLFDRTLKISITFVPCLTATSQKYLSIVK